MRALDPRLVRRARAVRVLLGVDVGLGIATTLLVLVQATLLARIVARAFDGAGLGDVAPTWCCSRSRSRRGAFLPGGSRSPEAAPPRTSSRRSGSSSPGAGSARSRPLHLDVFWWSEDRDA